MKEISAFDKDISLEMLFEKANASRKNILLEAPGLMRQRVRLAKMFAAML